MLERPNTSYNDLIEVQQPGFTLEQPFYNDPGVFELDLARVLSDQWYGFNYSALAGFILPVLKRTYCV